MPEINLADNEGRDAVVSAESVTISSDVRWIDDSGGQVSSCKILRSTLAYDLEALQEKYSDEEALTEALIQENPEVDLESFGSFLEDTSRVYVDPDNHIVHRVTLYEVIRTPEGEVKDRRPKQSMDPNVATELPLKWTGKKFPKSVIYRKFIFSSKMQITHINGLTYAFLYDMAKTLEAENCMMLIAGGTKGNQPLMFRRGGLAYRGFLEGRTEGKKYALILHLTNMELKAVERPSEEGSTEGASPGKDPDKSTTEKPKEEKKKEAAPKAEEKEEPKPQAAKKKAAPAKKKEASPTKKKTAAKKSAKKKSATKKTATTKKAAMKKSAKTKKTS